MNKRLILIILFIFGVSIFLNAQDTDRVIIKGKVINSETGEPLMFANVGVLGTNLGVASNIEGEFELNLPNRYANNNVRVSVVGFSSFDIKVSEAAAKGDNLLIRLNPITFTIAPVSVYAESLVYRKMLRLAAENISKNYIARPYNYKGYFQYSVSKNNTPENTKEAIVTIYDSKGYERTNIENAFNELNYSFSEIKRNKERESIVDGMMYFDDIITGDIVRNTRNVLDLDNVRDYTLKNNGQLLYEGDSVQIIGYEIEKPSISNTGEAGIVKYSGEIYINIKDYAVLKNIVNITSNDFSILGRNIISTDNSQQPVNMTIITNYKKIESYYFLSGITIQYKYTEDYNQVNGKMQYLTTSLNVQNPQRIAGRTYYEDLEENPKFWDSYTIYFDN